MKNLISLSENAISNMAVIIVFALILLGGVALAQTTTLSKEYWHPNGENMVMLSFSDSVSSSHVMTEMNRLGLRPANVDELIQHSLFSYDSHLFEYSIAALGTHWSSVVARNYFPYNSKDGDSPLSFHHDEMFWGKDFIFMAFSDKSQFSFPYLDYLYEASPELKNDTTLNNNKGFDRLFINDQYRVVMWSTYHPSVDVSRQTWMNEFVVWNITYRGQIIKIANELSYQSIENPKIIRDNLVFKAIDRSCKHGFYTVVPLRGGKSYNVMPN